MHPITIVIIDDHKLIRETWTLILKHDKRFKVVAECGYGEEGIELCKQLRPDIVMLDINLPDMNGLEAVPLIRKFAPGTKIMGVSLHTQPSYVKKMMQKGAYGYITKNSTKEEMFYGLMQLAEGKKYVCEEIKNILNQNLLQEQNQQPNMNVLSVREMEIVHLIMDGGSSKEISQSLNISVKTVEVHRYNILKKLNLKNAAALVNYANRSDFAA